MKKHIVKCRYKDCPCRDMDLNQLKIDIDWIMPSKNWYFHPSCYEKYKADKKSTAIVAVDEPSDGIDWLDKSWQYLKEICHMDLMFGKFKNQWDSFIKHNCVPKGIYFCLRYAYDVKKMDTSKAAGGIGIVKFIYDESKEYWYLHEQEANRICDSIVHQIEQFDAQVPQVIYQKKQQNKHKKIDLSTIGDD